MIKYWKCTENTNKCYYKFTNNRIYINTNEKSEYVKTNAISFLDDNYILQIMKINSSLGQCFTPIGFNLNIYRRLVSLFN